MQTIEHHFQGQHENEQIIRIIHRHWFDILSNLLIVFALSFALIGSLLLAPLFLGEFLTPATQGAFLFIETTMFIFLWLYAFLIWIDYYFDVWIITNERIVNIEQKGLFTRRTSELRFDRVQDVTSSVNGFLPTILNFGDVFVQTAAEEERFIFRQVPDPIAIKDEIMRLSRDSMSDDMRHMASAFHKDAPSPNA